MTKQKIITLSIDDSLQQMLEHDLFNFKLEKKATFIRTILLNLIEPYNILLGNTIKLISNTDEQTDANLYASASKYLEENIFRIDKTQKLVNKISISLNQVQYSQLCDDSGKFLTMNQMRSILHFYFMRPQYEREIIVFQTIYKKMTDTINDCNEQKKRANLSYKKEGENGETIIKETAINPIEISHSKEELYNYLIFVNENKSDNTQPGLILSLHLHSIVDIKRSKVFGKLKNPKNVDDCLKRMHQNGVQFSINEKDATSYTLKLTPSQFKQFNKRYLERPVLIEHNDNKTYVECKFNCSYYHLKNYFSQFNDSDVLVKQIEALSPNSSSHATMSTK